MSLRELARSQRRTLGPRPNGRQDQELHLASPRDRPQFRFLEWTPNDHLRHATFVGVRDDKAARTVLKEVESEAAKRKAPQRGDVDSDLRRA